MGSLPKGQRGQGRKKGGENNRYEIEKLHQQMKDEIIEFILQGYPFSEIIEYLQLNYNINYENAKRHYQRCHLEILDLGEFDIEVIITQHVYYYEEAARFFDSIGNYSAKGIALNAKEKLLKIFDQDEPEIEIENNVNINVNQLDFDIEKLTVQEKDRFSELFKKVRFLNEHNK